MLGLGRLVSAYIYIGLFTGMMVSTVTSLALIYIIALKATDIVDRIKQRKHKGEKYGK
jgi:hypothetical protein